MEYQLQQLASLTLVGIKETYENGRQAQQHIAGFWQRCYQEGVIADLQLKNNGDLAGILGLCISELGCIRMVILQVKNILQKFGCLLKGD